MNPLVVPVGKPVLEAVLEDVLQAIRQNRAGQLETADERLERDLLEQQREEFLAWVRAQPGPNISIALYPIDGLDEPVQELDLTGLLLS